MLKVILAEHHSSSSVNSNVFIHFHTCAQSSGYLVELGQVIILDQEHTCWRSCLQNTTVLALWIIMSSFISIHSLLAIWSNWVRSWSLTRNPHSWRGGMHQIGRTDQSQPPTLNRDVGRYKQHPLKDNIWHWSQTSNKRLYGDQNRMVRTESLS